MTEFIKILLSLSLSGTLLMLLVLLPKPLYRERFSRRWQYYIWVVVALRFVLPFTPENTLTGYLFTRMETAALPDSSENVPAAGAPAAISGAENDVPVMNRYPESRSSHTGAESLTTDPAALHTYETQADYHAAGTMSFPDSISRKLPSPGTCLFVIWLTVTIILLVRKVTVYQSFISFLKRGGTQVSDIEILNLLAECQERLGIRGRVELCTNPMIASPVMVGFFRPCILLPAEENPENESASLCKAYDQTQSKRDTRKQTASMNDLYYIFTHELIHYKRQDMLYKWFVQLILCVHWFNPFVCRLAREMNKACELACDEAVTASLDDAGKRAYGNTLLAFLRTDNTCCNSVPYVTLTEGAKDMKERLGTIMKSGKKSKCMSYITAMVTLIICISFTALGAYAKSGSNTLPKNASPKTSSSPAPSNTSSGNVSGSNGSNPENDSSSASLASSSCEYDNGVYYIYIDGADLSNKPLTGFTDGTIGVVLVQKDGYTSLGPFDAPNADSFREQFTQTCEDMVKDNILTRKNADTLLSFSEDIIQKANLPASSASGTTSGYTFVNRCYYQDSYIMEMGWNLSGGGQTISLARRIPVPLSDGSEIGVYFADGARDYAEDADALSAIGNLIVSLRKDNPNGYPDLERPLISRIRKVNPDDLPALAGEYLEEHDLAGFSAVFSALKPSEQEALCHTLYENSNTSFFISVIPFLEDDLLFSFLDKAQQDENTSFFSGVIISGRMSSEQISSYMEKCYKDKNMSVFSILIDLLKEEQQRIRLEKLNLSIIHESAEIRFYEDGSPYLHDVLTNYTDQTITETEYCLLAYNADGQPLKLKWNFMDSSSAPAYSHLVRTGWLNILPGQTEDYQGGWSLEDAAATEMAYNILCLKTVTFEDGTVWNNPEYESWYQTYAGKEINVSNLTTYYPHVYTMYPQ